MKDPKLWLAAELPKLVEKKIIPAESATALRGYYALDTPTQTQRVAVILCSILGGTLIGAGIILLIAHNWEDMGRPMRTVLSILPLIGACFISGWAVLRKPASDALNESAGIFHLLSIGAAISLVSQTYHISGDFSDFILIWSLLGLPLIYLLRSTATALLYLAGITVWAGSRMDNHANMLYYWPMAVAVLPFYGQLLRQNRVSIRANWLSLGLGVSVPFALGFQCNDLLEKNWFLLFSGYFTLLYLLDRYWFQEKVITFHPFRFIGAGGIAVLTIAFSYSELWKLHDYSYRGSEISMTTYFIAFGLGYGFVAGATGLLFFCWKNKTDFNWGPAIFPLITLTAYLLALRDETIAIGLIMNAYAILLALTTIIRGFQQNRLGTLNAGMGIASALIIARFFDSNLSFIVRGLAFICIGIGFLAANWIQLKKRRTVLQ